MLTPDLSPLGWWIGRLPCKDIQIFVDQKIATLHRMLQMMLFASLFRGVQLSYPVFGVATSIFTAIFTTYPNIILVASYIPVYSHDIPACIYFPNLTSLGRTVVLIFTGQSILKHKKISRSRAFLLIQPFVA
jgi:hypothetical protein